MPDSYKVEFIENYVRSKGGIPSLICIENKGRRLGSKSRTEIELLKTPSYISKIEKIGVREIMLLNM